MNFLVKLIIAFQVAVQYVFDRTARRISGAKIYDANDVQGKVVVITGANSGLGKSAAWEFAKRKAVVVMACRNIKQAEEVKKEIVGQTGADPNNLHIVHLDLSDLSSVREAAKVISTKFPKIDLLLANAGIAFPSTAVIKTKDGFERHFGVNHLGHFLLVNLLLPNVKSAAPSRIVITSSTMARDSDLNLDNYNLDQEPPANKDVPYGNSKFCNALFCSILAERLKDSGVTTYAVCPGLADTPIFDHMNTFSRVRARMLLPVVGVSAEQGAEVIVYCATAKDLADESGKFYRFSKPFVMMNSYVRRNRNIGLELWDLSERLVGIN